MIFLIESVIACLIFTACVILSVSRHPIAWIADYPPEIQERAKELGLIPKEQKRLTASFLIKKSVASLVVVALLILLMHFVNGAETFGEGFLISYGLWNVVAWYDAFVIDCMWFCHSKKIIIPGTENMVKSYHDYFFHIKMSMRGMLIGLPVCLLAACGTFILN